MYGGINTGVGRMLNAATATATAAAGGFSLASSMCSITIGYGFFSSPPHSPAISYGRTVLTTTTAPSPTTVFSMAVEVTNNVVVRWRQTYARTRFDNDHDHGKHALLLCTKYGTRVEEETVATGARLISGYCLLDSHNCIQFSIQ